MARKFFLICAGMFLLALSYHVGAKAAGATTGFASPSEVTVLQGFLGPGEAIPLPVYADGTTAPESECHWAVSLAYHGAGDVWCYTANALYGAPPLGPGGVYGSPGYFASRPGRVVNVGCLGNGNPLTASYIIIATRQTAGPTSAGRESWGQLKSRYASNGGTVSKGADTR